MKAPIFVMSPMADRVRPNWRIYRSLGDRANLRDCYLLRRNFSASGG